MLNVREQQESTGKVLKEKKQQENGGIILCWYDGMMV